MIINMIKCETYFSELKDIANYPEHHTSEDLLDVIYDLTNEKNVDSILKDLQYRIEQHRLNNDRCAKCNGKLKYIPYKEKHEYQGVDAVEELHYRKCMDCGKIYD